MNSHIKNVTGHNNETSLEAYDSRDDNEMYGLSCAISNVTPSDQSNKDTNVIETGSFQKKMSLEKNFSFGVFSEGSQKTCNEYTGPSHSKNVYV